MPTFCFSGLFKDASFFNHSNDPNISRYSVGPVTVFRTNRPIAAGEELCISYVEQEALAEWRTRPERVAAALDMDFAHADSSVESQGQINEQFDPSWTNARRLSWLCEEYEKARSCLEDIGGFRMSSDEKYFNFDLYKISYMMAVTYLRMSRFEDAFNAWLMALNYCENFLPPNDELTVNTLVYCALSALAAGKQYRADAFATRALAMHHIAFGEGIELFRSRYFFEFRLDFFTSQIRTWKMAALLWGVDAERAGWDEPWAGTNADDKSGSKFYSIS